MSVFLQEQFMTSMHESNEELIDKESKNLNESMQEIDRKLFASLNKESDGHYYILVDGNYEKDFYADSDEEAIAKFRKWTSSGLTEQLFSDQDWDDATDDIWSDYYDGKISDVEKDKRLAMADKMLAESSELDGTLWASLSGAEQMAVENALDLIRQGVPIEDAVLESISLVNWGNAEPEYEDEEFYEDEADYSKVMNYVKQYEGLNESLGADYSNVPEVTTIKYNNGVRRGLPGITNMTAFISALEEIGKPEFKIRTSRFPLSKADIKDEWMALQRNGWSISQTWDSSLPGFNEIYICQKK